MVIITKVAKTIATSLRKLYLNKRSSKEI